MRFDKDEIKNNLTISQIAELVGDLGGEPEQTDDNTLVCSTICHNEPGHGSHKLYYYDNTKLFSCYTQCSDRFDVFDLVRKVKNIAGELAPHYEDGVEVWGEYQLNHAVYFVASYFGFAPKDENILSSQAELQDWKVFEKYAKIRSKTQYKKPVEMKTYDLSFLKNYPHPHIKDWEDAGIKKDIIDKRGICYDPVAHAILIPHYDINGNTIGLRQRTLIKEREVYGKYRPAIINKVQYNHPLNFNLYNLNNSKDNIKLARKAILFEGEKSPLLYASYFGEENDISVATCGSTFSAFQFSLLKNTGAEEIIIAYDKQFQEIGDKEWEGWTKKLKGFAHKYGAEAKISFMFDKWNLLGYKDAPIDRGPEIFIELFNRRVEI